MAGKLIALEGTDGSGKSTQFALLCARMEKEGKTFGKLNFPRYSEPSSTLVRMYLNGDFGSKPDDVNCYAASTFYAVDRYASWKEVWQSQYESGALILSERYTTSNAVHQTGKLPEEQWESFVQWLFDFEYNKLGLPEPNMVLYLDMPTEKTVEMLRSRESKTDTKADIHEVDTAYLARCRQAAGTVARLGDWQRISCVDEQGNVRSIEDIHEEIWNRIVPYL